MSPKIQRIDEGERTEQDAHILIDAIPSVFKCDARDIDFVVEGLIASSAITMITGEAGAGKTTFATSLAAHVVSNQPFFGRACSQRKALILDRENTAPVVQERLKRLRIQDGGDLKIWGGWLSAEAPDPGSGEIAAWVASCSPKPLIVVDSMIAFLKGDENDSVAIRAFMNPLRALAHAGAAVVLLHHVGKGESWYRGSSDIPPSIDTGYRLTNLGEGQLERLRLKAGKIRFPVESDIIVRYRDGEFLADERSNAVNRTVTDRLTELLRQNPGAPTAEFEKLAHNQGLGRNRARGFLSDGVRTGAVCQEIGPKNTKRHYLVDSSENLV